MLAGSCGQIATDRWWWKLGRVWGFFPQPGLNGWVARSEANLLACHFFLWTYPAYLDFSLLTVWPLQKIGVRLCSKRATVALCFLKATFYIILWSALRHKENWTFFFASCTAAYFLHEHGRFGVSTLHCYWWLPVGRDALVQDCWRTPQCSWGALVTVNWFHATWRNAQCKAACFRPVCFQSIRLISIDLPAM